MAIYLRQHQQPNRPLSKSEDNPWQDTKDRLKLHLASESTIGGEQWQI